MNRTAIALLLCLGFATAQEKTKETKPVTTRHSIGPLGYDATAGYMEMKSESGDLEAKLFYVAYAESGGNAASRPVTFVFNGGPGSASLWLHLGTVGPRRVAMTDRGDPLPPPGGVVDNAEHWLDFTDLVFIDPIGTGYSRPAGKKKQSDFSGLEEDVRSVGEFIRRWTVQNQRWGSPKFLCGESYGTTRASHLSNYLQGRYGMYLNGIVLVSAVLNFQTIRFGTGNDLPYVTFLPTYTATAHYFGKIEGELPKLLEEAKAFALNEYLVALARGDALAPARRQAVVAKLARLTGLSPEFVERSNLRISQGRFCKELLRAEGRTVGRLDSRFKGIDRDSAGSRYEYDPSMAAIGGAFPAAVKDYLRRELKYENDIQYRTLGGLGSRWKYPEGRYVNVAESLRQAMTRNQHLKVLVTSGYYDFATSFFAADYTVSHLGLDPELRDNIRVRYYEAGHMMYIHTPSRKKLKADVADFYRAALKRPGAAGAK